MRTLSLLALLALFFTTACGPTESTADDMGAEEEMTEEVPEITLTPMPASPDYPDAAITSMTFTDGKFSFAIAGDSYKLGMQTSDAPSKMCANSAQGQHIHLIVDDEPYAAKYEADFDYEIPDGEHYLLAFLSRSYHESIKHAGAATAVHAMISGNSMTETKPIDSPMLFYSRPKGTYVGDDAKNLMLDFYLVNATLGNDYKVKVEVDGEEVATVANWQPYFFQNMPMGEHKITLTLLDAQGQPADVPLNPVSRMITLQADPADQAG
ncbi:MAG: hypothetical protein KDC54_23245 [Lewinella sp.]|nr:hypothetical protein [Lewinella sp.]